MYLTHGNARYPLFSETFRYLTCTPLIVKYGISKLTLKIGEVNVFLSSAIEGKLNFILAHSALPPGSDFLADVKSTDDKNSSLQERKEGYNIFS